MEQTKLVWNARPTTLRPRCKPKRRFPQGEATAADVQYVRLHDAELGRERRASLREAAVYYLAGYGIWAAVMLVLLLVAAGGPFIYIGLAAAVGLAARLPRENSHLQVAALIVLMGLATWRFPDIGRSGDDHYEWIQFVYLRMPFAIAVVEIIYLLVLVGWVRWPWRGAWDREASESPPTPRRAALGVLVFCALLVVAGFTHGRPILIEAPTERERFHPFTIEGLTVDVDGEVSGTCEPSQLLPYRRNAWACLPVGTESMLDPCFEDVYRHSSRLACVSSPWDETAVMFLPRYDLSATDHPPATDAFPREWAYELNDGRRCLLAGSRDGRHLYRCDGGGESSDPLGDIVQERTKFIGTTSIMLRTATVRAEDGRVATVPVVRIWD